MRNTLQPFVAVSALLLTAVLGNALPATGSASEAAPAVTVRVGLPFEDAVSGAVHDALDAERVVVEFLRVDVMSSNAAQRELAAHGRVAVGDSGWMPLDVSALYDLATGTATVQRLSLGDTEARQTVAAEAVATRLSDEASRRLQAEFAGQSASMHLAVVQARQVGNGLLALEAIGRADFADDGVAATSVQALYDPSADHWVRLDYRLGGDGTGEPVARL